ncbi:MAG: DciA family protein [Beijerinckiaceae bacterium]|nr:DciA family protein [Beijerinckiaceae bacterium]
MSQSFNRKPQARPLGALMGEMMSPVLKARGFANIEIITRWDEIVGAQFAGRTRALQLKWPPRGAKSDPDAANVGATLVVAVSGGAAIELQHMAPQVMERVNATLGWRCVTKIALRQQPLPRSGAAVRGATPLSPDEIERLEAATSRIDDENLRHALLRLGKGVIQKNKRR